MNYVIDIDKLSNGVDYWRNPDYKPQGFNSQCSFFKHLKRMQKQGRNVCAFSKSAEKNMPEISRWFQLNGVNIPVVYKQDNSMTPIWNDKVIEIDPKTGEFIITQPMSDNHVKKTTYAPVQVEVTNTQTQEFEDTANGAQAFSDSYGELVRRQDDTDIEQAGANVTLLKALMSKIKNEIDSKTGAYRNINGKKRNIDDYPSLNSETAVTIKKISDILAQLDHTKTINDKLWDDYDSVVTEINKAPSADQVTDNIKKLDKELSYRSKVPLSQRDRFAKIINDLQQTRFNVSHRVQLVKELARLRKLQPKADARKKKELVAVIKKAISDINSKLNAKQNNITDANVSDFQAIILPEQTAEEKAKEQLTIQDMSLQDQVNKFNNLTARQKLIAMVTQSVPQKVLSKAGATKAGIIDDIEGVMSSKLHPKLRQALLNAKTKEEIVRVDALQKIINGVDLTPKQFDIIAKDYDMNGASHAQDSLKKITQGKGDTVEKATDSAGVTTDRGTAVADKLASKNLKKINDLNADLLRHQQAIDSAKPEDLAQAEAYIRDKQRVYDRLKRQIATMKKQGRTDEPQYQATLRDLEKMHRATPFTALQKAILLKKRNLKQLKYYNKRNSAPELAKKVKNDDTIAQAQHKAGEMNTDEKIALIKDTYGMDGNMAKDIASLYSASQISNGIPLVNNQQYKDIAVANKGEDFIASITKKDFQAPTIMDGSGETTTEVITDNNNSEKPLIDTTGVGAEQADLMQAMADRINKLQLPPKAKQVAVALITPSISQSDFIIALDKLNNKVAQVKQIIKDAKDKKNVHDYLNSIELTYDDNQIDTLKQVAQGASIDKQTRTDNIAKKNDADAKKNPEFLQAIQEAKIPQYDKDRLLGQIKADTTIAKIHNAVNAIRAREADRLSAENTLQGLAKLIGHPDFDVKLTGQFITSKEVRDALTKKRDELGRQFITDIASHRNVSPNDLANIVKAINSSGLAQGVALFNNLNDGGGDTQIAQITQRQQQLEAIANPIERTALLKAFHQATKEHKTISEIDEILKKVKSSLGNLTN